MKLLDFVKSLNPEWVLAPIYRKGASMLSGKEATGKNPLEVAFDKDLGPADVAYYLEKNNKLGAVGLFTGRKGKGIVILDVDYGLGNLKRSRGESLKGAPIAISTKKNAAKYIFRIPEELWGEVSGFGHGEDHNEGYEVLWGQQGVIYGDYPGSKDGKWPAGQYSFDAEPSQIENVPVAPEWLIAEMKAAKTPRGLIKNKAALDLSDRSEDEIIVIVTECLGEIENRGAGNREHWVKIGMAIHSVLPNDEGLRLWSEWSAQDVEFADEWERGNPCETTWHSFKPGRIGLGSLIWEADRVDPKRSRMSVVSKNILEAAEARVIQQVRQTHLSFAEVVKRAKEILEIDNPAQAAFEMNGLALEAGYRDAGALERLLISQSQYETRGQMETIKDLLDSDLQQEYTIPELLPCPGTVMIHGQGGDGKSMAAWTVAKHVARGTPFKIRGQEVPVKQGPVLVLNGDQNAVQVQQQLIEMEFSSLDPIHIFHGWDLNWRMQFAKVVNRIKPRLVIVDSITGCTKGSAYEENKKEFAEPVYHLTSANGKDFHPCSIIFIHHSNKNGGFRGTTALRDGVDEVWRLEKFPKEKVDKVNCRLVTVDKSRAGRGGSALVLTLNDDLTFSLGDYIAPSGEGDRQPASVADRVLIRLRAVYPAWRTRVELTTDQLLEGSPTGVRKALQRLVKRGLVEQRESPRAPEQRGSTPMEYRAVLAQGVYGDDVSHSSDPSQGQENKVGHVDGVSHIDEDNFKAWSDSVEIDQSMWDTPIECPTLDSLPPQVSDHVGHSGTHPPKGDADEPIDVEWTE